MKKFLLLCKIFVIGFTAQMQGQAINESFNDITTLVGSGWALTNNSTPLGLTGWSQGVPVASGGPFDAFSGATNAYISANYNNTTGGNGTISNWLITPNRTLKNGDVVSFYTKKPTPDTYPDRIQLRISTNGASTNVGASAASVGDFTTLLLSVNPTLVTGVYPTAWTQYSVTISGLAAPTSGRLAFRYYVTGAGPTGLNSDYIGIDNFVYTPYVCPSITMTPAAAAITAANGGMAYSFAFGNAGTLGTPTYTLVSGALPAGLSLSSAGVLSGTPTTTGNFTFGVTVADNSGCSTTRSFTLLVNNCTLNFVAPLPDINAQCSVAQAAVPVPVFNDACGNAITPTTNAVFPITAQGTTTITWSYQPLLGGTVTRNQNIVIIDSNGPVPTLAVLPNITAQCQVSSLTDPAATDNCSGVVQVFNDATLPITTQGTTLINWTYLDANGNTTSQTQNVVITDTTGPTPNAASLPTVTGQCSVSAAAVGTPSATDNCSGTVTVTNNATFPITASGTTVITWTYTDAANNSSTQTQNVVIADTTAPVADAASLPTVTGQCSVSAAAVGTPSATDNCSGAVSVTNNVTFPITASGTTVVTWTYTDAANNSSTQTQNVVISDTTAPVADAATLPTVNGQCSVSAGTLGTPSATDNCSAVTVTNNASFPITAAGTTVVTWTYTDAANNSSTQTQNVVIADTIAPVADAASLPTINGQCSVSAAAVGTPSATDNCSGAVSVTNNVTFPITASGTTVITWMYMDAANNMSSQTQNVVIADTTAPTADAATLPAINAQCQVTLSDVTAPTATDNCSGTVTVTNNASFPITTTGTVITWTYTDAANNSSTQTQNVVIADTTAPVADAATLPTITGQCSVSAAAVGTPSATDNCSGAVSVTNNVTFPITASGTTVITWMYMDAANNMSTQTQNVVISDTTAPVADAVTLPTVTGQCSVNMSDVTAPTATDNCSSVTVTNDATFPITGQGTTTITWTYTDAANNTSTQTQSVTIMDNTNPTVMVQDITVSVDVAGNATVTGAQMDNGSTDNCGISTITVSPNTFSCSGGLGAQVVTVTVTDVNGNSASSAATVTVNDPNNFCALAVAQVDKSEFVLYPNPTSNVLYIQPGGNEIIRSATVYSITGQVILKASYTDIAQQYSVSLAPFADGIYILKLETSTGLYTQRIVKQNR